MTTHSHSGLMRCASSAWRWARNRMRDSAASCVGNPLSDGPLLAEYDFMAPAKEKNADAAAFISNCNAQSFRLDALRQLSMALGAQSDER